MFRLLNMRESCNLHKCKIGKYIFDIKCCCLICIRCKSYYQVLGINSAASPKDIKSAYYELSLKFHPDKNNGCPEAVDKFREITEAYEVLSNPEKRKSYDQGYTSSYNSQNYTQDGYYKPYYARHRYQKPFTGRTKDFNYDEHYRQHYEKQRQDEYENLKRRWEAEYYRRYSNRDREEYYRNRSEYYRHRPDREEYYRNQYKQSNHSNSYEEYSRIFSTKFRMLYFLIPVWCFFLIIPLTIDFINPERYKHGPIYYKIRNKNGDMQSNDVQNNK